MDDATRSSSAYFRPAKEAAAGAAPSSAPDVPGLAGVRVLVVDDEPDQLELAATSVSMFGAEVDMAGSAREAMTLLRQSAYDVLVCDLAMPGESGFSLIAQVRALESGARRLRAAALTGFTGDEHAAEILAAGFDVHVPKPVDPEMLATVVGMLAHRA